MEGTTSALVYKGLRWLQGTKHSVFVCVVSDDEDPQMKCDATDYLWGVACRLMYVLFIYFSGNFFIILILATQSTLI